MSGRPRPIRLQHFIYGDDNNLYQPILFDISLYQPIAFDISLYQAILFNITLYQLILFYISLYQPIPFDIIHLTCLAESDIRNVLLMTGNVGF